MEVALLETNVFTRKINMERDGKGVRGLTGDSKPRIENIKVIDCPFERNVLKRQGVKRKLESLKPGKFPSIGETTDIRVLTGREERRGGGSLEGRISRELRTIPKREWGAKRLATD